MLCVCVREREHSCTFLGWKIIWECKYVSAKHLCSVDMHMHTLRGGENMGDVLEIV